MSVSPLPKAGSGRVLLLPIVAAALLCAGFTAYCGSSHSALASTFGGVVIITIALPPLVLTSAHWLHRALITLGSIGGVIVVWFFLPVDWPQWWACSVLLAAYAVAILGCAALLCRLGLNTVVSAAIVVVIGLAWLSWPVWLSPWIAGRETFVDRLSFAHPLLSINGILIDQGIWTERPLMYGWTALNQDVSYSMPAGVWWCVLLHVGVGLVTALFGVFFDSRKREHESTRMKHESSRS